MTPQTKTVYEIVEKSGYPGIKATWYEGYISPVTIPEANEWRPIRSLYIENNPVVELLSEELDKIEIREANAIDSRLMASSAWWRYHHPPKVEDEVGKAFEEWIKKSCFADFKDCFKAGYELAKSGKGER